MGVEQNPLQTCLTSAGWKPRDLARAVNAWLDTRGRPAEKIHPTTPYSWSNHGFCPYDPYPEIVVEVLSHRLGYPVTTTELWPRRAADRLKASSADDGLDGSWTAEAAVSQLDDLVQCSDDERARYKAVTG